MCLISKNKPERAREDITVWKVLTNDFEAPIFDKKYHLGTNFAQGLFGEYTRSPSTGYHCYGSNWLHACRTKDGATSQYLALMSHKPFDYILVEVKIPRGTKYCVGVNDEVCARKFKIEKDSEVYFFNGEKLVGPFQAKDVFSGAVNENNLNVE